MILPENKTLTSKKTMLVGIFAETDAFKMERLRALQNRFLSQSASTIEELRGHTLQMPTDKRQTN